MAEIKSEGGSLTMPQAQAASDAIAKIVFNQLRGNDFVFSDDPAANMKFDPKSIVQNDAGIGLVDIKG
jgi:hypothetical protein